MTVRGGAAAAHRGFAPSARVSRPRGASAEAFMMVVALVSSVVVLVSSVVVLVSSVVVALASSVSPPVATPRGPRPRSPAAPAR